MYFRFGGQLSLFLERDLCFHILMSNKWLIMKRKYLSIIAVAVISVAGCAPKAQSVAAIDPLPSWNATANKQAILDFVTSITDSTSAGFVPVEERIAVFDNDGTLWCEQPVYFEFIYSLAAMKDIVAETPALLKKAELKALADGDMKTFMASGEKGLLEAFAISHTAVGIDRFEKNAEAWLDTAKHARFDRKYTELTYKPMVELLDFLRSNGFTTYIVSGGSSMFIRAFSDDSYGIPSGQVIGTMFKAEFVAQGDSYNVVLKPEVYHIDDNVGKPVGIYQFIGRKPILAFGNSDGDLQMLQWTSTNQRPNMVLLLHHTDEVREYAYDRESSVGRLDKALDEARAKGWTVVDMKNDFARVFSFER